MFGAYTLATNEFTGGTPLNYTGVIQALARVQKLDIATAPAVAPAPQTYQNPTTWVTPGPNVLSPLNGCDGFRMGSWIKMHGISLSLRLKQARVAMAAPLHESTYVYWKLCATIYDGSDAINAKPDPEDLLSLPRFGYSQKIDTGNAVLTLERKIKTFASGKVKLPVSTLKTNVAFVNKYVDLSQSNFKVEYNDSDQNGAEVMRWKPFLVIRCNIPDNAPNVVYQPLCHAVTKIHYVDS